MNLVIEDFPLPLIPSESGICLTKRCAEVNRPILCVDLGTNPPSSLAQSFLSLICIRVASCHGLKCFSWQRVEPGFI